jgi:outer membrane protein assembly factor BamB
MLKVSRAGGEWKAEELWRNRRAMHCKFASPVYREGFIYGLHDGALQCLDAASGEVRWTQGPPNRGSRPHKDDYLHGQVVLAGDRLIVLTEKTGMLVLVEATPEAHRELGSIQAVRGKKTWNNPAVGNGIIYVRNDEEMAAFDIRAE